MAPLAAAVRARLIAQGMAVNNITADVPNPAPGGGPAGSVVSFRITSPGHLAPDAVKAALL
jgi:hypothetical protein